MSTPNKIRDDLAKARSLIQDIKSSPEDENPEILKEKFEQISRIVRLSQVQLQKCSAADVAMYKPQIDLLQKQFNELKAKNERDTLLTMSGGNEPKQTLSLEEQTEQSLERSAAMTSETIMVASKTLGTLQQQGEQLTSTNQKVNQIDQMMDQSEYLIRGIRSIGGAFTNIFRKTPVVDPLPTSSGVSTNPYINDESTKKSATPSSSFSTATSASTTSTTTAGGASRSTQKPAQWPPVSGASSSQESSTMSYSSGGAQQQQQLQVKQDKSDVLLGQISSDLTALKHFGIAINGELDRQNKVIEDLDTNLERVNARVEKNTKDIKKILGKP